MDTETAARRLGELGNPKRLAIVRMLVRAGPEGMVVGDVQRRLEIPASTLSHHLARLTWNGLIRQERQGRSLRCFARHHVMDELVAYLTAECCLGFADQDPEETAA